MSMKSMKLLSAAAFAATALGSIACQSTSTRDAGGHGPIRWEGSVMTALQVNDLAAAKKWYGELFGFKVVYDLPEHGWCELSSPLDGALIGMAAVGAGGGGTGTAQLSFGVKNIDEVKTWLDQHGVQTPEVMEIPQIVKLLQFKDPDGNTLMLYQPATN
jgi:predicted enzyme related to lactoylglutathione lyase